MHTFKPTADGDNEVAHEDVMIAEYDLENAKDGGA